MSIKKKKPATKQPLSPLGKMLQSMGNPTSGSPVKPKAAPKAKAKPKAKAPSTPLMPGLARKASRRGY